MITFAWKSIKQPTFEKCILLMPINIEKVFKIVVVSFFIVRISYSSAMINLSIGTRPFIYRGYFTRVKGNNRFCLFFTSHMVKTIHFFYRFSKYRYFISKR